MALPVLLVGAAILAGCTSDAEVAETPTATTSASPDRSCAVDEACDEPIEVHGAVFEPACISVPRFLLDVPLGPRWGGAKVRAIAAVPAVHAVSVLSPDPDACGEWLLALRTDLSPEVRAGIELEVRTAASLPPDPVKPGADPAE